MPPKNDNWKHQYAEWRLTPHGQLAIAALIDEARGMARRGYTHYSMQALVYIVRQHRHLPTAEDYKLNNNYTRYLATEISAACPDLPPGFFASRDAAPAPTSAQGELLL